MRPNRVKLLLPVLALAFASLACAVEVGGPAQPTPEPYLTVLASPDLADLQPLLPGIEQAAGTPLKFVYQPTITASGQLAKDPSGYDLAWLASSRYLQVLQEPGGPVFPQQKVMRSPVVVGVKLSKAQAFGWADKDGAAGQVSWSQIADKASSGDFRYAMPNPNTSNAGFFGLAAAATALSGESGALTKADLDRNPDRLRGWIEGQALTAPSSADLEKKYLDQQDGLDGIVTYESSVLALNAGGSLKEKLVVIYPQEGVLSADYPLLLANPAKPAARAAYDRLRVYLLSDGFQKLMAQATYRRPVVASVLMQIALPPRLLIEQPFPPTKSVIQALLGRYAEAQKQGLSYTIFLIDVSKRMEGSPLDEIKKAFADQTGGSVTLKDRQKWTILAYNQGIDSASDYNLEGSHPAALARINAFVANLTASGNKAMFDALLKAYTLAQDRLEQTPDSPVKVVLISGGKSAYGSKQEDFSAFLRENPALKAVHAYTIAVAEADPQELQQVADQTGGKFFDGTQGNLLKILQEVDGLP